MTTHPAVEAMARGMYENGAAPPCEHFVRWAELCRDADAGREACIDVRRLAYSDAIAALRAAEEAGYVLVPMKPTRIMVGEANRLNHPRDEDVWNTMVSARPKLTEDGR